MLQIFPPDHSNRAVLDAVSVQGTHSESESRMPLPTSVLPPLRRCRQIREPLVGAPALMRCLSSSRLLAVDSESCTQIGREPAAFRQLSSLRALHLRTPRKDLTWVAALNGDFLQQKSTRLGINKAGLAVLPYSAKDADWRRGDQRPKRAKTVTVTLLDGYAMFSSKDTERKVG